MDNIFLDNEFQRDHNNSRKLQQQAEEVLGLMEDMVSYYCDENRVSGEKVWTMIFALSDITLSGFQPDEVEEWTV